MSRRAVVLVAAALALSACGPVGAAENGAPPPDSKAVGQRALAVSVVIPDGTLSIPDQILPAKALVTTLEQASNGLVGAQLDESYSDGSPDSEARLVRDLASGQVQVAVMGSRAYVGAGVGNLDVLEAPFLITSYAAQKEVVRSDAAQALLQRLDGTGIKALALVPGPLRHPVSSGTALLGPDTWTNQSFRTYSSPVQDEIVRAIGGLPVRDTFEWYEHMLAGKLRGGESDVGVLWSKDAHAGVLMTSNVVLWPKVYVIAVNQEFWDGLTDTQRGWFAAAATSVRDQASAAGFDESRMAAKMCDQGVRFATATTAQVAALDASVAPVRARLEQDPLYAQIRAIGAAHPVSDVPVPAACRGSVAAAPTPTPTPTGAPISMLPDGTYRTTVTEAQVIARGLNIGSGPSGTWTLVVSHGREYTLSCLPNTGSRHDCGNAGAEAYGGPLEAGTITPEPDGLRFLNSAEAAAALGRCKLPARVEPGYCNPDDTYYTGPWTLTGDTLTFASTTRPSYAMWFVSPWTRIG